MMYSIIGRLEHIFDQQQVNKETGEETQRHKIQLVGRVPLPDGSDETRLELVTLNVDSLGPYKDLVGDNIRVPFGFFAPSKGTVIQFVPKGARPQKVTVGA
jgi:hypothetical protein